MPPLNATASGRTCGTRPYSKSKRMSPVASTTGVSSMSSFSLYHDRFCHLYRRASLMVHFAGALTRSISWVESYISWNWADVCDPLGPARAGRITRWLQLIQTNDNHDTKRHLGSGWLIRDKAKRDDDGILIGFSFERLQIFMPDMVLPGIPECSSLLPTLCIIRLRGTSEPPPATLPLDLSPAKTSGARWWTLSLRHRPRPYRIFLHFSNFRRSLPCRRSSKTDDLGALDRPRHQIGAAAHRHQH